jgi:hypothetical protein
VQAPLYSTTLLLALASPLCTPVERPAINDGGTEANCQLLMSPARLEWDIRASEAPAHAQSVTLQYTCPDNVPDHERNALYLTNVDAFTPSTPTAFHLQDDEQGDFLELEVGEQVSIPVVFNPPHGGTFKASLPIKGGGRMSQPEPLVLVGKASGPSPVLRASTIPETLQWCSSSSTLLTANDGPDRMLVQSVTFGESADCDAFSIEEGLDGRVIPAGESYLAQLNFHPERIGQHTCNVLVKSDLPTPHEELLLGQANPNTSVKQEFTVSDGSGANILLVYNNYGPQDEALRRNLADGLGTLADDLNASAVDFRLAAVRTGADLCPAGPYSFVTRLNSSSDIASTLGASLFASTNVRGDGMLELMTDAAAQARNPSCFGAWLQPHEPLHIVVYSPRDDDSDRTVAQRVQQITENIESDITISVVAPNTCGPSSPRLRAAAELTGGLLLDSCLSDWDTHWSSLAELTADLRVTHTKVTLDQEPLARSVRIAVNGESSAAFTVSGNDVLLSGDLPDDSAIDVLYTPASSCR